jgi:hypothetical protein
MRQGETMKELIENLYDAIEGCLSIDMKEIRKSLISKFDLPDLWKSPISELPGPPAGVTAPHIEQKLSPQMFIPADKLVEQLSFTHITELLKCEDQLKRAFYEIECVRGNWSVRELKRQIGSLYYERSALSKDKAKLAEMVRIGGGERRYGRMAKGTKEKSKGIVSWLAGNGRELLLMEPSNEVKMSTYHSRPPYPLNPL